MRIKHKKGSIIAKRDKKGLKMALNIIEHDICTPIPYPSPVVRISCNQKGKRIAPAYFLVLNSEDSRINALTHSFMHSAVLKTQESCILSTLFLVKQD